jgi:hypothetical protein
MSLDTRVKGHLREAGARLSVPPPDLERVASRGRRRRITKVLASGVAAAVLIVGAVVLAQTQPSLVPVVDQPTSTAVIIPWGATSPELTMLLPDGWEWDEADNGLIRQASEDPATFVMVGSSTVANIWADRCQWTGTELDPPVGPTVDDLATAFATVWGPGATAPVDAVLDGFAGKHMVLTVPTDIDFADCDGGEFRGWSDNTGCCRYYQGPGQIEEVWILDVDGDRILVRTSYFPELSAQARAEQQQVIESIHIQP